MSNHTILGTPGLEHQIRRAPHVHIIRFFGKVDRLKVDVHGYTADRRGQSKQAERDLKAPGMQGEGSGLSDAQSGFTFRCPDWENCAQPLVAGRLLTDALVDGPGCAAMPDPNRPWVKGRGRSMLPFHLIAPGQRTEGKATDQARSLCGLWVSGRRLGAAADLAAMIYETSLAFRRPTCTYCLDAALGEAAVDALHGQGRLPLGYE